MKSFASMGSQSQGKLNDDSQSLKTTNPGLPKRILARLKRPLNKVDKAFITNNREEVAFFTLEKYLKKQPSTIKSATSLNPSQVPNQALVPVKNPSESPELSLEEEQSLLRKIQELDNLDPRNNKEKLKKMEGIMERTDEMFEFLHY